MGKIPWRRAGDPRLYSCLENPMAREAWWAPVNVKKVLMTQIIMMVWSLTYS